MNTLDVKNLTKDFGNLLAVNDVSFSVQSGQVIGLIGPNGAGKTTLLRMLATILEPTGGEIKVLGYDASKEYLQIRERIGYLPDFFNLYDDLTIKECLTYFATAYNVPKNEINGRIDTVLNYVNLQNKINDFVQNLSRGMIQRLGLAVLLIHKPDLFLLDEPASGLDPKARIELRNVLKQLSSEGVSIIISSHILTELSDFCSHILILDQGKLITYEQVDNILNKVDGKKTVKITVLGDTDKAVHLIRENPQTSLTDIRDNTLTVQMPCDLEELAKLNTNLVENGLKVISYYEEKTNLEDVFMKISPKTEYEK